MARKVNLSVNGNNIELNPFVESYVYHVAGGIIASLKGTEAVKKLELAIENGDAKITLNGKDIPLNVFATDIIINTMSGMVTNFKGVEGKMKSLQLKIEN